MIPRFKKRRRRCLKCRRLFWSEGPWNRLCSKCRAANRGRSDAPTQAPRWNGEPMGERGRSL